MAELARITHGGDRHSAEFRRASMARRGERSLVNRSATERVLAAIYTARFAGVVAPTITDVCRVSGCSTGRVESVVANGLAVRVGAGRVRLSGHGKAWILEAAGRDQAPEEFRPNKPEVSSEKGCA